MKINFRLSRGKHSSLLSGPLLAKVESNHLMKRAALKTWKTWIKMRPMKESAQTSYLLALTSKTKNETDFRYIEVARVMLKKITLKALIALKRKKWHVHAQYYYWPNYGAKNGLCYKNWLQKDYCQEEQKLESHSQIVWRGQANSS